MLGSAVEKVLTANNLIDLNTTSRLGINSTHSFDVGKDSFQKLLKDTKPNYIINCIGVIKSRINENSFNSVKQAINVNSLLPHIIQENIDKTEIRMIQIATDCVFSGFKGKYTENDLHDPLDVYGKSKSLGEIDSKNCLNLRVSIVGPELNSSTSLLEWFLNKKKNALINGYSNHLWNGISTYHFGRICEGIITANKFISGKFHLIPEDFVSKYTLLNLFRESYSRWDIKINETLADSPVDRTLSTEKNSTSNLFWLLAGYQKPPTISKIITEMKSFFQNG